MGVIMAWAWRGVHAYLLWALLASSLAAPTVLPGNEDASNWVDLGDSRVAGGRPVRGNAYPWAAEVKLPGNKMCGGALISCRLIVTAAHCIDPYSASSLKSDGKVILGNAKKDEGKVFGIADVHVHPHFDKMGFESTSSVPIQNDVAIITLDEPTMIRPVRIAGGDPRVGSRGYVLGWGETESSPSSSVLRQALLEVNGRESCESSSGKQYFDPRSSICTGSAGDSRPRPPKYRKRPSEGKPVSSERAAACQGDSGGPFTDLRGQQLWGIISYAINNDASSSSCGDEGTQTVVSSMQGSTRDFIRSHMSADSCLPRQNGENPEDTYERPEGRPDKGPESGSDKPPRTDKKKGKKRG